MPKWLTGLLIIAVIIGVVMVSRAHKGFFLETLSHDPKAKGPQNAKLTLTVYSDFQCPACGAARPYLEKAMTDYPDSLRMIFRHYPLTKPHRWAKLAAIATQCAAHQDKFWPFHDMLYNRQKEWSQSEEVPEFFAHYAKTIGLNTQAFVACVEDPNTSKEVEQEQAQGKLMGVDGTPTVFVGNQMIVGSKDFPDELAKRIREALGRS